MTPTLIIYCVAAYFACLLGIAWWTGRNSGMEGYFLGNRASPWFAVAFGMLGDSLSGVTYISVPGEVLNGQFSYFQLVLGYFAGYFIIGRILLPLYYRMNLISVYGYLETRFGTRSRKTGAVFFILSRLLGASARLFLAAGVIQFFIFDRLWEGHGVPFWLSVSVIIILMVLYTFKGGIKTLVWTDAFQSLFLILGVVLSIAAIISYTGWGYEMAWEKLNHSNYTRIFFFDWHKASFFWKQFLGGVFIAVAMTGLDQNMMQKNLSCRSLKDAQKNMFWFSVVMVVVNVFFLALGALLYLFMQDKGITLPLDAAGKVITDRVFPNLAFNHLGVIAGLVFILGLTAATFSSADSVLTTLTTSTAIDLLEIEKKPHWTEQKKRKWTTAIHILFAVLLWICILIFHEVNSGAVIKTVLLVAGYSYGPLLGLYSFGIFCRREMNDKWVPIVCLGAPLLTYFVVKGLVFLDYEVGNELIIINGGVTWLLLFIGSTSEKRVLGVGLKN